MNSEGSALKENEKYLDSIQGKTDVLTNSMQTLWNNALQSDFLKWLLDVANALVKAADSAGLFNTAIATFVGYKAFSSKTTFGNIIKFDKSAFENKLLNGGSWFSKLFNANQVNQYSEAVNQATVATEGAVVGTEALAGAQGAQQVASAGAAGANTVNAGAETAVGIAATAASIGVQLLNAALTMGISLLAGALIGGLIKGINNVIHRSEKLKEEVQDLKETYEDAKKTFDDNLATLTTSSDTSVYATLEDEFRRLTKGVDQYGNNISLTSDQYERYKEICEKIVGIQPSIAAGYDSATKAIGNNANVLSQLIELQKIQARQNVEKLITGENFKNIIEDAKTDYSNAKTANSKTQTEAANKLEQVLTLSFWEDNPSDIHDFNGDDYASSKDDLIEYILHKLGVQDTLPIAQSYYSKALGDYDVGRFILDYYDEIKQNTTKFSSKYIQDINNTFSDIGNAITSAGEDVKEAQDSLVDTFLLVPQGERAGQYYDQLNDASKKFITEWIKNGSQFKIDNNRTEEAATANRDKIIDLIKDLAKEDFTTEFKGEKITGQDLFDQLYDFDMSTVNWSEYREQINEYIQAIWKLIGGNDNKYGIQNQEELRIAFGIDFTEETVELENAKKIIAARLKTDVPKIEDYLENLSALEVKAFYTIDWNEVPTDETRTWADVYRKIQAQIASIGETLSIKTYSELSDSIANFNEIQRQTEQIILDNTEVTQEYKDSLIELGISEEDLSDCFDDNNTLVVKNASKLKQLVNTTKTSISTQTALARAQARLKYRELYKQLASLTNGQLKNAQANKTQINTLYQEMSAVQKMISKYSLLEQQLAEVTKTYTEFEEAQTIDSDNDYMSKTEDMLVAAIQAYQTGELGTETAQVSIKALVPDFVFEDPDVKTVEDKAEAAHDYLMETLNKYFVLDFDDDTGEIQSAEMKMGNLRKFIEDGFENNVFNGADWQHFEWSDEFLSGLEDAPDKLQYFADKMKVTKEVALAVIQEINNHDIEWLNGDYGSLFDQIVPETLDAKLQTTTARMAELNVQLANGKITQEEYEAAMGGLNMQLSNGAITQDQYNAKLEELNNQLANGKITQEEYTRQMSGLNGQLVEQQAAAVDACNSFIDINDKIDESQKKLEEYQKQLSSGFDSEGNELTSKQIEEINKKYLQELQNYEGYLKQKKELENKYGPMTEYTVSIALEKQGVNVDNIDSELTETKNQINNSIEKLNSSLDGIEVSINDDGEVEYKITDKTEPDQLTHLKELGALNEDGTVNISLLYGGLTDEQKAEVDKLSSLQEKENLINYYLSMNGVDTVQTSIDKLVTTLENIYKLLETSPIFSANVEPETKTALDNLLDKVRSWVGDHVANFISNKTEKVTTEYVPPKSTSNNRQNLMYANGTVHANGTAHATGSFGLPSSEKDSLMGELGPEMVVDPHTGRYYTVGDNGAEMVDLPKGAIIFNHRQTEDLLKHGYVTSRGKMLANGTAHAEGNAHVTFFPNYTIPTQWTGTGYSNWDDQTYDAADALQDAADSLSDAADDFEEVFDWIEVRLEELDETLDLLEAQLENAAFYGSKNSIINSMIGKNQEKIANLTAGIKEYTEYSAKLLAEVPEQYRDAAQNGMIAITEFAGEADEATVEAIKNYREWAQKVADLNKQLEETKTNIRDLAIEKFDNAYDAGDVRATVEDSQTKKLQNAVDYDEERGLITSDAYYIAMMENSNKKIEYLTNARIAMQKELDDAVKAGQIIRGSNEWYELIDQMYQIQSEIDEATIELEQFQNAINDLYWDNFDELINRLDYLSNETQNLIDLMDSADMVTKPEGRTYEGGTVKFWTADDVQWTEEGIASLGLYAQQMEIAEYKAKQYAEAIDDLTKDYQAGKYSENEYLEKLNELKDAQYDAIESYYDAQDAIKELNQTRIDAIKDGISKEIDAYEELISKKKEELNAEKDLYDFQKSTAEQQKNIADIQRKLAALSGDNSASAIAQRKKLEAELAEAKADLEDSYYQRSIEDRSNALDKELEDFQDEKNAEIEKWDEYLENIEQVVADSLNIVQANASGVYDTLSAKAQEYDLTLSDAIMTPWQDGALAVSDYQSTFDTAMSSTMDQLEALKNAWQEVIDKMAEAGEQRVSEINEENANYAAATYTEPAPSTPSAPSNSNSTQKAITIGGKINASGAKIYSYAGGQGYNQYFASDPIYTVLDAQGDWIKVRHHSLSSGVTGWFKKGSVKAYAKGSKKIDEDQLAILDELGPELVLSAGQDGRLQYITRGSSVIPSDISENLMKLGQLDPQDMLDRNRPAITPSKSIVNNEINISVSYGDVLHIEEFNGDDPDEIAKIVAKQLEKNNRDLNNALRRFAR